MLTQTRVVMVRKNQDDVEANKSRCRRMKALGVTLREMIGITQELNPARFPDPLR